MTFFLILLRNWMASFYLTQKKKNKMQTKTASKGRVRSLPPAMRVWASQRRSPWALRGKEARPGLVIFS